MPFIADHQQKFTDLRFNIENQEQLRKRANGGNSILFSYLPLEEDFYTAKARELYSGNAEVRCRLAIADPRLTSQPT